MAAPRPHGRRVLYTGAQFHTQDADRPRAEALLVRDGWIERVYRRPPVDTPTGARRVDLGGGWAVPGLADAHLHLRALGQSRRVVDLRGLGSARQVLARVRRAALRLPTPTPLVGVGWDQNLWKAKRFPDRAALDPALDERVVVLHRVDGHAAWVSTAALRLAGIAPDRATDDPEGGHVVRDATGRATGVLIDRAIDLVTARLAAAGDDEIEADLRAGAARCARLGLTSVHDMGVQTAGLRALRALDARGLLPLRVFVWLSGDDPGAWEALATEPDLASRVQVRGIKLFVDGALGSRGAALLTPYADAPAERGLLLTPTASLRAQVARVGTLGRQAALHAIGDRGNRLALEAIEALGEAGRSARHRVEHVQVVAPEDLPRFGRGGVVASMQPIHAVSDMAWAPARLGEDRLAGAYAPASLLRAGATLALGSDAPIESADPLRGIAAAVTRTSPDGQPPGGWRPLERLTAAQALHGFTLGAAFAAGQEQVLGRLRVGYRADFTVLDVDLTAPGADLWHAGVLRTVVDGKTVWRRRGPGRSDRPRVVEKPTRDQTGAKINKPLR